MEKCRRTNWKHGKRSAQAIADQRAFRLKIRALNLEARLEMKQLEKQVNAWLRERRRVSVGRTPIEELWKRLALGDRNG
jgi:hypothetical protein